MDDYIVHHGHASVSHNGRDNAVLGNVTPVAVLVRGVECGDLAHLELVLHGILTKPFDSRSEGNEVICGVREAKRREIQED